MGIRLKLAETAKELDDVFSVRRQVYTIEEGKYRNTDDASRYLADRFDAHPLCANLIAYEGDEPVATIRINLDTGGGLPPDELCDFGAQRDDFERTWLAQTGQRPCIGSAGMLAVRKGWRRRRDIIRALFKLAAAIGKAWNVTHVLVAANHENVSMYQRVGLSPVSDKIWVEAIGNYIRPMAATFADFHQRSLGLDLENVSLFKCFANQFQRAVFRAGERLFSESDEADECYVVDVGSVKITTNAPNGRELGLALLGRGEIFGEMALIDATTRSANATAVTDTEVVVLRRDDFANSLKAHPERLDVLLGFISERLRKTGQFAKMLAYGSPAQRLEFALQSFFESTRVSCKADGSSVLRAGPGDLAAAAGTEEDDAIVFLDSLKKRGICDYTDKRIRFLPPYSDSAADGPGGNTADPRRRAG